MSDEKKPLNEGEGSRTAARRYEEKLKDHLKRGDAEKEADRAASDVDANPSEYRDAEEAGKSRSAGEAPGDLQK